MEFSLVCNEIEEVKYTFIQPKSNSLDHLSDNALMLDVKAGNIEKLGLLYERYKKRLFGFFYQMNQNAALSEDLVQNVFMRLLKYKHTYTIESNFISWMFQIARNVSYDHFKKDKKNRNHADVSELSERVSDQKTVDEELMANESKNLLREAMSTLASDKKEILVLSRYKELKYSEIGSILGCSEGAARTKAHRALNELKNVYLELEKRG